MDNELIEEVVVPQADAADVVEVFEEAPAAPVVEVTAPIAMRYEYQPTDENGRPIGNKQVIKYTNPEELAARLSEQNTLLIRKLRSETRKNRLGIRDDETIPQESPRFQQPVSFEPRALTPEEKFQLSRDLVDPENFDAATDSLFEAKIGVKPEELRRTLAKLQEDNLQAQVKSEVNSFMAANPDYVVCEENRSAITSWMMRYELAPVRENFQKAYNKLRADGVLVENYQDAPEPEVPAVPAPAASALPVVEIVPAAVEGPAIPAASRTAAIPTGLSRSNSDEVGVSVRSVGDEITYDAVRNGQVIRYTGMAAIDVMPSEEFRRRVNSERGFAQKYEKLEKEIAERRQAQRR